MPQLLKASLALLLLVSWHNLFAASKISIINTNGECTGFNDPRPASAVGGNHGITLGQQRLNAFQYAANLLGQHLVSSTEIRVDARINPLGGSQYSALLGQAGPMSVARDFSGAPSANTYYPIALAEALYGGELNGGYDIVAEFNADLDTDAVLGSRGWYYGLNQGGGSNIDFVTVVMHELLHGLGFLSLVGEDGKKFNGRNDSYLLNMEGHSYSPAGLSSMTDAQRANAMVDTGNLHWTGSQVSAKSGALVGGIDTNDHVFMYAPSTYDAGASASHFSTLLSPNEGMEPFYTGPNHKPGLGIHLLKDIGWNTTNGSGTADLHLDLSDAGFQSLGETNTYTLTVTNNGSSTAVETIVTYMVPHGHEYLSANPSQGNCSYANQILSCRLGNLGHMGNASINISVKINAAGNHTHSAIVSSATSESSINDNRVIEVTSTSGNNDLSLNISPLSAELTHGSNYNYKASVTNHGPSAATNLMLQVTLPAGVAYYADGDNSCCYQNGNYIQCHLPELGQQQRTDFSFTINASATGNYSGTVSISQSQSDSDTSNNSVSLGFNIKEEDECFIATAAYGSIMEKEVRWLRRFRDLYLLPSSLGQGFVDLYYKTSPPLADFIRESAVLRAITRGSLGPLVVLSRWLTKED